MRRPARNLIFAIYFLAFAAAPAGHAETGAEAWLRYAPLDAVAAARFAGLPATTALAGDSPVLTSAQEELVRGVRGMLGRTLRVSNIVPDEPTILLGTVADLHRVAPGLAVPQGLEADAFWIGPASVHGHSSLVIASPTARGVLYGVFNLLQRIALQADLPLAGEVSGPSAPLRWVDQWDNLDGRIERGYAGPSLFFENGAVRADLTRAGQYARLLASIGINGCAINNVNANPRVLERDFLPQIARVAGAFRPWGVRLSLSVDLSSPQKIGGLDTFDPLDPRVIAWWQAKVDEIYAVIPDFAGFVVKADSEGREGPSKYARVPSDAANTLARALKPHAGIVFYRAFVYDHHLDWQNPKNDRARAAYDIFHPLDGKFDDNVVVQIKHGPIDFQAREPVSPLLGGLRATNEAIELQVTQEYTGQQHHVVYLAPMWKEVLDFDLRAGGARTRVSDLISGNVFHRPTGGYVGVVNAGMDVNWMAHPLALANLYAFGRLAWDPDLSARVIVDEWTRLTFGNDPEVVKTITSTQMDSWPAYETYTGPLGLQTLTDITGSHFGPNVESSERNGWGQWHRADASGVGMDRTVATGTGYTGQYSPPVAALYESAASTPDELLLFFHHVPYSYKLQSGNTVIQEIYDAHYRGAARAQDFVARWKSLRGRIDDERFASVLARLEFQAGHAIVWRDAVCTWFFHASGIADAQGRVGHYPGRVEAESMQLQGYTPFDVTPPENASGGKGIECTSAAGCSASFRFGQLAGWYELDVEYFDQNNGQSRFRVYIGQQKVDEWVADGRRPARKPGGDSSTRRRITGLALRPGDEIRIEGIPDADEHAALDYIELLGPLPNLPVR